MGSHDKLFGIQQFCGQNFESWQFRVTRLLKRDDCEEALTENPPETTAAEYPLWKKRNANVECIITACVAESHLQYIRNGKTAKEMWQSLKTAFGKSSFVDESLLRRKILHLRVDDSKPLAEFLLTFDDLLGQLTAITEVSEMNRVRFLLDALPESYDPLVTALENLKEDELTMAVVRSRLLSEEPKRSERQQNGVATSSSFATQQSKAASYNSNQVKKSDKPFKGQFRCYNCGGRGHKKSDCKKPRQPRGGSYVAEQGSESVAFISGTKEKETSSQSMVWVLDSGATDHQINKQENLKYARELVPPIQINVAKEGQSMKALMIGRLDMISKVGATEKAIMLKDVLYVPELRRNLISIKRMAQAGVNVTFTGDETQVIYKGDVIGVAKNRGGLYMQSQKNTSSCDFL